MLAPLLAVHAMRGLDVERARAHVRPRAVLAVGGDDVAQFVAHEHHGFGQGHARADAHFAALNAIAPANPRRFAPPFGVEQIHVTAFTDKPEPLPTVKRVFDGEEYMVVGNTQALVKHRGIKRKKEAQVSEALLSISTTPR